MNEPVDDYEVPPEEEISRASLWFLRFLVLLVLVVVLWFAYDALPKSWF